jgi:hypothetical protein
MDTTREIEKDVPTPAWGRRGRHRIYPWNEMEVGDSFILPYWHPASAHALAHQASKRLGRKFKASKITDGQFRVWRVA